MLRIIGLTPLYDTTRHSYWMLPNYMQMLQKYGAVPLMMPLTDDKNTLEYFIQNCDGFVLTGGQDVSPLLYNEQPTPLCGETCLQRDLMEQYLIDRIIATDKPMLGICRGVQILNAVLGGTLYQDLPVEYGTQVQHCMTKPYDRVVHYVKILPNTPLSTILSASLIGVNSYHHQAIHTLAPSLQVMGIAEDGLIEAVFMPQKRFIVGVQWHPELSYVSDHNSELLIHAFLNA